MPNGRSGGFVIEKAELRNLIKTFPDDTVLARVLEGSARPRLTNALETTRLVSECPNDRVAVEEQDHAAYIIHLRDEPEIIWLAVLSDAPLFLGLRQRHRQWTTQHPDWKGWFGF
jgi:hypothetical protein